MTTARKPSSYPRPQLIAHPDNSGNHGGVPQLIATQPGEENGFSERYLRSAKKAADQPQETAPAPSVSQRNTPQVVPRPPVTSVTKRFHLSKATSASLTPHSNKRKRDVAVFVSEDEIKNAGMDTEADGDRQSKRITNAKDEHETARPRKRPGVGSATPTIGTPRKTNVVDPDPEMQDALQQYAMEEFGITYGQRAVSKVPKSEDVLMTEDGDEAEYTYDTYMRHDTSEDTQSHTGAPRGSAGAAVSGPDSATNSYGILVIPDEQEELFLEVYGEDATSDDEEDWDSEQDDENAENYYAADYPEDEVESDDEYGMGAYQKYRRHGGGSDDEEFGSEDEADVDEDGIDTVRYPWAQQLRATGGVRRDAEYDKSDQDEDDN